MMFIFTRVWSGIKWGFRCTWFVPLLCLVMVGQWALMVAIFCGGPSTSLLGSLVLAISGIPAILALPLLGLWFISSCFLKQPWATRGLRLLCAVLSGGLSFGILNFCVLAMMFQNRDHTADNWRVPEGVPFEVPENFWVEDKAPALVKQLAGKEEEGSPYNFKAVKPLPDGDFPRRAEHLERLAQEHPKLLRDLYRRAEVLVRNDFIFTDEDDAGHDERPWLRCHLQLHGPGTTIRATYDATLGISNRLDVYRHDLGNGWYLSLTVERVMTRDKDNTTQESMERLEGYTMQRFDAAFAALADAPTAETLDAMLPLPPRPSLHLVQGFQPGMYELSLFLPQDARTDGHYEIRAYEYESGEALSLDNQATLDPATAVELHGAKVLTKHDFMVYTGDWGQYYGSRWQVWFVPNKGEREMVCQHLFLMQGWMR